jgi:hypothetical protein
VENITTDTGCIEKKEKMKKGESSRHKFSCKRRDEESTMEYLARMSNRLTNEG